MLNISCVWYLQILQVGLQEAQVGHELPAEVGAATAPCLRGGGQQFPHVDAHIASYSAIIISAALLRASAKVQNHKTTWKQSEWREETIFYLFIY